MKKKKIALIVPHCSIIVRGAIHILRKIFPKEEYKYYSFVHMGREAWPKTILDNDYDYILLVGDIWLVGKDNLLNGFHQQLRDFMKRNRKAKKILFGGGSCFPEYYTVADVYREQGFGDIIKELYGDFDLRIVRDSFAKDIFEAINLEAHYLPCPSMFLFKYYPNVKLKRKRKYPLIILGSPKVISAGMTTDKRKREIYVLQGKVMKNLGKRYRLGTTTFTDFLNLMNTLPGLGFRGLWWRAIENYGYNPVKLFGALKRAKYVVSARLHCATPASLLGIPTYLIPFDTRKYVAQPFNIKVIHNFAEIKPYDFKKIDIDGYEQKYVELLRKVKSG